jgi:hypothetical protein
MPTIDHVDPYGDSLAFEVCSWQVNLCKSFQNPKEFLAMCCKIVEHRKSVRPPASGSQQPVIGNRPPAPNRQPLSFFRKLFRFLPFFTFPALYLLPTYLEGICSQKVYSKWLLQRARELYKRDKKQKRPCALTGSRSLYRKAIHEAVCAGSLFDPYTGDMLSWVRICTWNTTKGIDNHDIFKKDFTLLPTVDHIDPNAQELRFEICSWLINCCKSNFTPDEFVGICKKVADKNSRLPDSSGRE